MEWKFLWFDCCVVALTNYIRISLRDVENAWAEQAKKKLQSMLMYRIIIAALTAFGEENDTVKISAWCLVIAQREQPTTHKFVITILSTVFLSFCCCERGWSVWQLSTRYSIGLLHSNFSRFKYWQCDDENRWLSRRWSEKWELWKVFVKRSIPLFIRMMKHIE